MTTVTAKRCLIRHKKIIQWERTPMTIRTHHTQQIVDALMKAFSRHHVSMPTGMDRRFLSDIGLSQSDMLALQVR